MRPQGVAIAILNVAVWLRRRDECIEDIRIAVGPAGPLPLRARAAEDALRGRSLDAGSQSDALHALLGEARFRTSPHRATAEYRLHVVETLLDETLQLAWERARLAEPV
jgi:CO/xanthine dehydrogenase FAD-binding subunit